MRERLEDDYHKKRREIDERHRRKMGVKPLVPIAAIQTKQPPSPELVYVRDTLISLGVSGEDFGDDWEKEVSEWFKPEFPKILKVWMELNDTAKANGWEDEDDGDISEWFKTNFQNMLQLWLKVTEAKVDGK